MLCPSLSLPLFPPAPLCHCSPPPPYRYNAIKDAIVKARSFWQLSGSKRLNVGGAATTGVDGEGNNEQEGGRGSGEEQETKGSGAAATTAGQKDDPSLYWVHMFGQEEQAAGSTARPTSSALLLPPRAESIWINMMFNIKGQTYAFNRFNGQSAWTSAAEQMDGSGGAASTLGGGKDGKDGKGGKASSSGGMTTEDARSTVDQQGTPASQGESAMAWGAEVGAAGVEGNAYPDTSEVGSTAGSTQRTATVKGTELSSHSLDGGGVGSASSESFSVPSIQLPDPGEDWEEHMDATHQRPYWYNLRTRRSSWDSPVPHSPIVTSKATFPDDAAAITLPPSSVSSSYYGGDAAVGGGEGLTFAADLGGGDEGDNEEEYGGEDGDELGALPLASPLTSSEPHKPRRMSQHATFLMSLPTKWKDLFAQAGISARHLKNEAVAKRLHTMLSVITTFQDGRR